MRGKFTNTTARGWLFLLTLCLLSSRLVAQSNSGIAAGANALNAAANDLKQYFQPLSVLFFVVAGLLAFVGGFRCYAKWQQGDQDVQKAIMGWVGSILFFIAIGSVIQAIFF